METGKQIVAIGDSLTYGYPFSPQYSWVAIAAKETGCLLINKGICGETTEDMLLRFDRDVLALKPAYVIITGGSNDAFTDIDSGEVKENLAAMLDLARVNSIIPLIGLPPPVDFAYEESLLQEYRNIMRVLAQHHGLSTIDFYQVMLDPAAGGLRRGLHNDGVHPNELGYMVMAQAAKPVLERCVLGG